MADTDGEVKIGTKLDTSGIDKGTKELKSKLEKTSKTISQTSDKAQKLGLVLNEASSEAAGFATHLADVASAGGGVVAGAVAAIAVGKKYAEVIKECTDAYKVQEKAEQALTIAAKNNPYINDEDIDALKEYASNLQQISDIGDETAIRLESELVSSGRSKKEIEKIMSAAADYAAATQTDIATAVQQLNQTYSGMAGTLGRQLSSVKNLTTEELEHGAAVDAVAEAYKGMAEALADTATQAQNAKGDFNEALGELFKPTVDAWDTWWKGFYDKGIEWISKIKGVFDWLSRNLSFGGTHQAVSEGVDIINTRGTNAEGQTVEGASLQTTEYLKWLKSELELKDKLNSDETQALLLINSELGYRERVAKEAEREAAAEQKKTELVKKQQEYHKTADDYAKQSNKSLDEELNKLEVEARVKGTSVSAQDKYNVILQNYIDLLTETEGTIQEGYPVEQKRLQQLNDAKKALDEATEEQEKYQAAIDATNAVLQTLQDMQVSPTPTNALQAQIEQYQTIRSQLAALSEEQIEAAQADNDTIYTKDELLEQLAKNEAELEKQAVENKTAIEKSYFDSYAEQEQDLLDLKQSIDESEVLSEEEKEAEKYAIDQKYANLKAQKWAEVINEINTYTQQAASVAEDAADLMIESVESETELELAALEEKYAAGEMSEEEYYEAQTEIKKKAAEEEYKINMYSWTASLLAATANIAQGVSKAIAEGGTAGIISGALVSAAGAVQIASIIASKPTPPQYKDGGIIGGANGASMGGDNTYIHARTGEMVLNAAQQRYLWDMINGQTERQQTGLNMYVNNTQSQQVATNIRQQNGDYIIDIVDKHVNQGFSRGTYDSGVAAMRTRQEGTRIL